MAYGDGNGTSMEPLTSIDICAHEIAHAISRSEVNLIYQDESGAIDEALSDIWAATIEYEMSVGKSTWVIGEDVHNIFRSMSNPNQYNDPDTYKGDHWYSGSGDNGGVHTNSGVMNFWYYLLVNGGTGVNDHTRNYSVQGINFEKAAKIVYRMETLYLTSGATYQTTRMATLQAAADLFGDGSNEFVQVANA